jgi:hypothetical protein
MACQPSDGVRGASEQAIFRIEAGHFASSDQQESAIYLAFDDRRASREIFRFSEVNDDAGRLFLGGQRWVGKPVQPLWRTSIESGKKSRLAHAALWAVLRSCR